MGDQPPEARTVFEQRDESDDWVVIGRLGAPYGVRGWLHFKSYTAPPDNALGYAPWHAGVGSSSPWRPLRIAAIKPHKHDYICLIEGCADRTAAEAWSRLEVAVPAEVLPVPEADEVYWRDVIGATVHFEDGRCGEVIDMLETGAHDVMVIRVDGRQLLIPFAEPYLVSLDLEHDALAVVWEEDWT